jgi:hypothetical protein
VENYAKWPEEHTEQNACGGTIFSHPDRATDDGEDYPKEEHC